MRNTLKPIVPWLRVLMIVMIVLSALAPTAATVPTAKAASPNLVISQLYASSSSTAPYRNDYVVIFNRGNAPASLDGMSIQYASATGPGFFSGNPVAVLTATELAPGQSYLVQLAGSTTGTALPTPDLVGSINMGGSGGKVVLVNSRAGLPCNGSTDQPCTPEQLALIVDMVGYGSANFFEGTAAAPAPTTTTALFRAGGGCTDTDVNSADFQTAAPAPLNTGSTLTACAGGETGPYVSSVEPASGAGDIALDASVSITFSEEVDAADGWFSISCLSSGVLAATASGGPTTFTLDPAVDFAEGELCTVTVHAAQVTDRDAEDPPDAMVDDYTWSFVTGPNVRIRTIQGAAHLSPLMNRAVADVVGIVTARTSQGFYMQDPAADANPATSEGVYVYTGSAPTAQVGDEVEVDANVAEYRPGGDATNLTLTELTNPKVTVLSSGNPLPAATVLGTGGRIPPNKIIEDDANGDVEAGGVFDPENDGLDFYESLEGMRVQVNEAAVVGPKSSYGEVPVIGDQGANATARSARGALVIQADDYNPERIILDDEVLKALSPAQAMPAMTVGDRIPGAITGVVDYSFGLFKLQVVQAPTVTSGGLIREVGQKPGAHQLAVASFNTENLSAAAAQSRFDTMAGLIVNNLHSPDVLALEEIQDNNGATNDSVVDAEQTLKKLVDAIQSQGGPQYSFRQINPVDDQEGGQGGGNIRVAFLYRTDRGLTFVDRAGADATTANAVIEDESGVHLQYSPGRIDPTNSAFDDSRKPLAGEFLYNGKRLFIIANHFNSKGGDQPLFGRNQPPVLESEVQRLQQAQIVHDFVQSILEKDAQANVIVLGDLNDFQFSKPMQTLKGTPQILYPLIETLPAEERYTYVYEGNAQALDHIFVSKALAVRPLVYDSVHVNAEFADQASDHDPQLLLISLPYVELRLPVIYR